MVAAPEEESVEELAEVVTEEDFAGVEELAEFETAAGGEEESTSFIDVTGDTDEAGFVGGLGVDDLGDTGGDDTGGDTDDGGVIEDTTEFIDVTAEAPDLTVETLASGDEDTAILLSISASTTDTSESITSIVISGVPSGAALSAGTDNEDGTWTLEESDLDGLTITPPEDSSEDFTLTVTATATESASGATATTSTAIEVDVAAVADAFGGEGTENPVDIPSTLTDTEDSEVITEVIVSDVPSGATLSAGTDNEDGTWTLEESDLEGLTITPPDDFSDVDIGLSLTATVVDTDPDTGEEITRSISDEVSVTIGVPTLVVDDASGGEGTAIPLDISASVADTDGSEAVTFIEINGIPSGATLSIGTDDGAVTLAPVDGVVTLSGDQLDLLSTLTITPTADSSVDFQLGVSATIVDTDADTDDDQSTGTVTDTLSVSVFAVADAPSLSVSAASGAEDTAISLDISPSLADTDGSEEISSVEIAGIPSGATLSIGTDDGAVTLTPVDGVVTLSGDQLDLLSTLSVTPPPDSGADFSLTVSTTATESDGGDTATTTETLSVSVSAVADAPSLSVGGRGHGDLPGHLAVACGYGWLGGNFVRRDRGHPVGRHHFHRHGRWRRDPDPRRRGRDPERGPVGPAFDAECHASPGQRRRLLPAGELDGDGHGPGYRRPDHGHHRPRRPERHR